MSKLVFPSISKPHRGYLGEVRGWLRNMATYLDRQPGAKPAISAHIMAFLSQTGTPLTLPNTQALVSNGAKLAATGSGAVATVVVNPTTKAVSVTLAAS